MNPIFVTGIGTGIGKTVVSAIIIEALGADYWKPIQAGYDDGTDLEWIRSRISNPECQLHKEAYRLKMSASPHIAARQEGSRIDLDYIDGRYKEIRKSGKALVIEGAGGLLVPLNKKEFVIDLIKKMRADVILVSRNYLGSINHSLMTALVCKKFDLQVKGWIFNDQYLDYENEIVNWSGYQKLGSVPRAADVSRTFIQQQAELLKKTLI
jgi:dethiobiotin synthetase